MSADCIVISQKNLNYDQFIIDNLSSPYQSYTMARVTSHIDSLLRIAVLCLRTINQVHFSDIKAKLIDLWDDLQNSRIAVKLALIHLSGGKAPGF